LNVFSKRCAECLKEESPTLEKIHKNHGVTGVPSIWAPLGAMTMTERFLHSPGDLALRGGADGLADRTGFCGFLATNCGEMQQATAAFTRVIFFDALSEVFKNVTGLGACRATPHNETEGGGGRFGEVDPSTHELTFLDTGTRFYKKYKFGFALENSDQLGHVTEKMMTVKLGGAVPIFWGDGEVGNYFNNKSFIHCKLPEISGRKMFSDFAEGYDVPNAFTRMFTDSCNVACTKDPVSCIRGAEVQTIDIQRSPGINQTLWEKVLDAVPKDPRWTREQDSQLLQMALEYNKEKWGCSDFSTGQFSKYLHQKDSLFQDSVGAPGYFMDWQHPFNCTRLSSKILPDKTAKELRERWSKDTMGTGILQPFREIFQKEAERHALAKMKAAPEFLDCMRQIKEIDEDDEKFIKMQGEPLVAKLAGSVLDPTYYGGRVREVMGFTKA
jgi:hypothetical protein